VRNTSTNQAFSELKSTSFFNNLLGMVKKSGFAKELTTGYSLACAPCPDNRGHRYPAEKYPDFGKNNSNVVASIFWDNYK